MNTYRMNEWKLILLISGTKNNNRWTWLSKKGFSNFFFKFLLNLAKGRLVHHIVVPDIRRNRLWQRTKREPTATLSGSNVWCGVEAGKDKGQQVIGSVSCAPPCRPKSEREETGNTWVGHHANSGRDFALLPVEQWRQAVLSPTQRQLHQTGCFTAIR